MVSSTEASKWLTLSITLIVVSVSVSASAAISAYLWCKTRTTDVKNDQVIKKLEKSLKESLDKCAAERQGRIRAQQELRRAVLQSKTDKLDLTYPMAPIAIIQSCFSMRNGTPRQPLIVPLARARLIFDISRVPPVSLEGLEEYSHCWIIYVFHLNTDLDKLWKDPFRSKLKAKVRVPRLKGRRMGLFATRTPHRPCPIGLTVAKKTTLSGATSLDQSVDNLFRFRGERLHYVKVEAVQGSSILLSGVDLVDGTPVLDVKPYLPYCDSIQGAAVPHWVKVDDLLAVAVVNFSDGFFTTLADCWKAVENKSLYASSEEFQSLIKQVLSWDIRSVSQRNQYEEASENDGNEQVPDNRHYSNVIYHLNLEGLDVAYRITSSSNVLVENVSLSSKSKQ